MRALLLVAVAACGPPQFEMDLYVSPELGTLRVWARGDVTFVP